MKHQNSNKKRFNQKISHKKYNGYVILTAVLIMLAITSSVSISMLLISTSFVNGSGVTLQGTRARQAADTCAEEALHSLRTNYNYAAGTSINLSVGGASCNVVSILGSGALDRTLTVEGFAGNSTSRIEIYIDSLNPIVISRWEYIVD